MLRAARRIQYLLFAIGFVILGYCLAAWMDSRISQSEANRELDRVLNEKTGISAPRVTIPDGGLVGRVEIPKLHLSAAVFQGADSSILGHGVGHVAGTALPGQPGNVALAAHRDTFFRGLRNIQKGDSVTVTTETGARTYQVDSTEVVNPTEIGVLAPTVKPTLTLITCYPFYYVGHAPKRFIVRAEEIPESALGHGFGPGVKVASGESPLRASR
jgi:sortase A